ncbi:unnamed protein product [Eruca vesicaria subsp. sativa]|uniref:Uncharacterized protein n=1 Tax=Eruca vesicaria subsp. sativa TaxID=29727 RepID=A0ABC8LGH7_ERUVS|nr:unnamed protein product [Eruca vesicaria subsp. sativa]
MPMPPPGPTPRPQQWYPHNPAVSVPPPSHLGWQQLFPVHGMGMTMPTSSPAMPVSQPLFPIVNSITPSQASPFSAPLPVGEAQQPSSVNAYPPNNSFQ